MALVSIVALIVFDCTPSVAKADALECPLLSNSDAPPLAGEIVGLLPRGLLLEKTDSLSSAITLLREHGLSIDDTIDRLVTLYCPAVNSEPGLTHNQRLDRVMRFAQRARQIAIGGRNVEDVVYDVPLPPGVAEAAASLARQSDTTIEKWIAQIVEAAIRREGPPIIVKQ
jgi:hypothetical protein